MKKLNWFARPEKFKNRLIMVILGVLIQGFGLSWLIEIHFGTDPCSAFLSDISPLPADGSTAESFPHISLNPCRFASVSCCLH